MPAYDLRSSAKTRGNRPYLPPQYANLMKGGYVLAALMLLISLSYFVWGRILTWQQKDTQRQIADITEQIKIQDQMLWLSDWKNKTVPMQELLVQFFSNLNPEVRLSSLIIKFDEKLNNLDVRIAINSDRNTSAQYFREMTAFFQSQGMSIISIQQNQMVGATVFDAKLRIMRKYPNMLLKSGTAAKETSQPSNQAES